MPENTVLQSAPYKCLQSQFSVLYGEVTQVGESKVLNKKMFTCLANLNILSS